MNGVFAPQGINVVVIIVILRSRSLSIVRLAMIPGIPQPVPTSIGMKDFPDNPNAIRDAAAKAEKYNEFSMENAEHALECAPTFEVCGDASDFFSIQAEDCSVYDYCHMGKVEFGETAV